MHEKLLSTYMHPSMYALDMFYSEIRILLDQQLDTNVSFI